MKIKHAIQLFVLFVLLIIGLSSFGVIDEGERGVQLRFGEITGIQEPGLYWQVPFVESMKKITTRTQTVRYDLDSPLFAASKDLQDVGVATVINYRINPANVEDVYRQYRTMESFEADVIRPAVRDTIKSDASLFTAEELVTKRAEYGSTVFASLQERLDVYQLTVERVNIDNIKFSAQYTQSIEDKVTAEQRALKAEQDLVRVEFEAQQRIEQSKAEAEAIRIQAEAVTQQGGKDYVQLQAIEKWNGQLPNQFVPGSAMPFLNLNN